MKEVFYKGEPFDYKVIEVRGKRHFQLFRNGVFKYVVEQGELDIKSIVGFILDAYYRTSPDSRKTEAAGR